MSVFVLQWNIGFSVVKGGIKQHNLQKQFSFMDLQIPLSNLSIQLFWSNLSFCIHKSFVPI